MAKVRKKVVNNQIVNFNRVNSFLLKLFKSEVHASRILSISNAVLGVVTAASLAISMIGHGLAVARGKATKHTIKQVDRLLGNEKFIVWDYFKYWVKDIVGVRTEVIIAMDWTEFDKDQHSTLALHLTTKHGRATPLLWKTHDKSTLKGNKNKYEKKILRRLKKLLPAGISVTILADRGFGYVELYNELEKLGFDFVIRFKGNVKVCSSDGEERFAQDWVGTNGRAKRLENSKVTSSNRKSMPVVVCVQDKKMKEPWCLAASKSTLKTREIINHYAKRWSIEPAFRDQKDIRFGMGMYNISISKPMRRDRLFFISAVATLLLTILGAASESTGMDKLLKANTVKRRTHSLFRQGVMLYELIPNMSEERLVKLIDKFHELLIESKTTKHILSFV